MRAHEEAAHIAIALRSRAADRAIVLANVRSNLIARLESLAIRCPPPISEHVRKKYVEKDLSTAWQLLDNDQAVSFILAARKHPDITEAETDTLELLRLCVRFEETGQLPDGRHIDELAWKETHVRQKAAASANAKQLRGKRRFSAPWFVAELIEQHDDVDLTAIDLWSGLFAMLDADGCDPKESKLAPIAVRFTPPGKTNPQTLLFTTFATALSRVRNEKS